MERFDTNKIEWAVDAERWKNDTAGIVPLHYEKDQIDIKLEGDIVGVIVEVAPEHIRQTFPDIHWYTEITISYGRGQLVHKWYV